MLKYRAAFFIYLLAILLTLTGCNEQDRPGQNIKEENNKPETEDMGLTLGEIKDIISEAELASVEILQIAANAKDAKPSFAKVRTRLQQHYTKTIIERYRKVYEENAQRLGNLGHFFPYFNRDVLESENIKMNVLEESSEKVVVEVFNSSDEFFDYKIYTLIKNGRWLIKDNEEKYSDMVEERMKSKYSY